MESKTDNDSVTDGRVVPIFYGEHYLIGDTVLRDQYEADKCKKSENTRPASCNEQCSFWTHKREHVDSTVDACETTETANEEGNALDGTSASARNDGGDVISDDTLEQDPNDKRLVGPLNIIAAAMPMDWSMTTQRECDACRRNNWSDDDDDDDDDECDDDECECSPGFEIVFESPSDESLLGSPHATPKRANNKSRKHSSTEYDSSSGGDEDVKPKHSNKRKKK